MKKNLKLTLGMLALAAFVITTAFTISGEREEILEIGAEAPKVDMSMADVSGEEVALKEIAGSNGLLVIFSCNTCPFVVGNGNKSEGWEGRYPELYDAAQSAGIGMVLVNSNEAKRDAGDSMSDMKKRYEQEGLKGHYVLDEKHVLADAFGALTTPHVFLFDENMKLIYKGAIDDSVESSDTVKEPYLLNAIKAHVSGGKIEPNSTKQLGCSIKRVKV
ncbi:MAG TPA: redoxin family protein [Cryomorphaceae bacterium]|nr:redoxin family protein [Cryomorphaceae bacterium]HKL39842.1 redoxin family protein [Cryomorphaceae bacterium]